MKIICTMDRIGLKFEPLVDEGTNGWTIRATTAMATAITRLGPDDVGERETAPPYDKPLRGVQVLLRLYSATAGRFARSASTRALCRNRKVEVES